MSMLKPDLIRACYICGNECSAGIQSATYAKDSTDENPKYTVEIIINSCEEHINKAKVVAKNLNKFLT
jgi:hypothetical protein